MDLIQIFGDNVRQYRKEKGLSQEKLGEESGLHRTYIGDIECYRRSISLGNIQKIADALEVEPYKLLVDNSKTK